MNKGPLYKKGDVVQLARHYNNINFAELPMIVLYADDGFQSIDGEFIYELLQGDIKIFLYEHCLEKISQ